MIKSVKNPLIIFTFFTLFFSAEIFAQSIRLTTFDDRPTCEASKGIWREFGNACADNCSPQLDQFAVCSESITYSCDCGKGRCWDGDSCAALKDFKKIFDKEQEEDQKIIAAAKEKRKVEAKQNEQAMMEKLINQAATANQQPVDPKNPTSIGNNLTDFYQNLQKQQAAIVAPQPQQAQNQQPPSQLPAQENMLQVKPLPIPNSDVPPAFLDQEKAKQAITNQNPPQPLTGMAVPITNPGLASTQIKKIDTPLKPSLDPLLSTSAPPGLPEIPLPN